MKTYSITSNNEIEINFDGNIPDTAIRSKMKAARIWWNPVRKIWHGPNNKETRAVVKDINENLSIIDYAFKLKIKDIIQADRTQLETWVSILRDYVNEVMTEENASHVNDTVSKSQELAWMDCFEFVAETLVDLPAKDKEYELIFEYSLPGTVHERPDVLLLTDTKVISLEFKRKKAPQDDDDRNDVAQAIRYKEWLMNHHKVTIDKKLDVKSYLICTNKDAKAGKLRDVDILSTENFCEVIEEELNGEMLCSFIEEWLSSSKTEMPDMLKAIEIMYREGKIPYISDVNEKCLSKVLWYINGAKKKKKKILILINGVPGAGKTAVGQSVVYEENKNGKANAVYLSGNGPLVEVLQYQIDKIGNNKHMSENAIQAMVNFKKAFFYKNTAVPEQSILIFDEAQRAWDENQLGKDYSEPEGLFRVGEKIYKHRECAVIIGLYGNGQVIYKGEEEGISLWDKALKKHDDWYVITPEELASQISEIGKRKIVDNDMFLPVSLRADFIDCSKWVEQAISRCYGTVNNVNKELDKLQKTSMRIYVTRDFDKVKEHVERIDVNCSKWKYGIMISNFAEQSVVRKVMPGWSIGYKGYNEVHNGEYGRWFTGECKKLEKACSVYGNQGLEIDCPIVLFGGDYIRQGDKWIARGYKYAKAKQEKHYNDVDTIVENNYRVLLTRARREMIILIPKDKMLDETYDYFVNMGMDKL
ncbi:DNA/RNA helicase domain-containing protein [Peptacetobacter sp. AB845]|uniref:DNA/RNA helicase domain-containing protein n=1 Tax=Peptacetobacter sp. AB845 TaxID=3388429 RepID=UPI0039C9CBD8